MYEVELKVPAEHDRIRDRLVELDCDRVGSVTQIDTYYDAPHRDFAETDEAFRVRQERDDGATETRITYKGPLVEDESKTREEFETGVEDGETMRNIAESLGFDPVAEVTKHRERYTVGEFTVTLDTVDEVGEFVEVETDVETEAAVEAARESGLAVLRDLGVDPDTQTQTSYLGMLLDGDASE